jgi:DNA-binding MarR family transcriptional regulator
LGTIAQPVNLGCSEHLRDLLESLQHGRYHLDKYSDIGHSHFVLMAKPPSTLQIIPFLHRTVHQTDLYLGKLPGESNVSQAEAHILAHLNENDSCSLGDLHEAFMHKRSTLTSIVDRLEKRSLVTRTPDPTDRRSARVALTSKGRKLAAEVHAYLLGLEQRVIAEIGAEELACFHKVLRLVAVTALHDEK